MKHQPKFLNTFPVKSHRLAGYDYGSKGAYFITVKTYRMKNYFGEIVQTSQGTSQHSPELSLEKEELKYPSEIFQPNVETCPGTSRHFSEIGMKAWENWKAIPQHFPFVQLDKFEVMPNHIHGILIFMENKTRKVGPNEFKSQVGKLGTIINLFKGSVTKFANLHNMEFRWHPRYHDTIIPNDDALENIRHYIQQNPQKWAEKHRKPSINIPKDST